MSTPLYRLTVIEAIRKIKSLEISAEELAKACIGQIEKLESKIKAWIYFDSQKCLAQAKAVDQKITRNEPVGALAGTPVGVKDIFNTVDMPTEMGSPIWKNFTPGNDARTVFYLRQADAVIAGKTVTAEFAVHAPGPTLNPVDFSRITGTSSSGSAAAVAANMVPCSLGTQTAGSVIRPASYCGVYGYKPSFGLLPRTGMLKTTDSLDTIGFFARCVEDLEILLEVLRIHGLDYPISNEKLNDGQLQNKIGTKWKVAVVKHPAWSATEDYSKEMLKEYASKLAKEKDIEVDVIELPAIFNEAHDVHECLYDKSVAYYFKNEFRQHTLISKEIKEMIEHGNTLSLEDYKKALFRQRQIAEALDRFFGEADLIVTLSTAGEPPLVGTPEKKDSCLIWTLCGVPTVNLPVMKGPEGLPVGIQAVARRYCDRKLLSFSHRLAKIQVDFKKQKMEIHS